MSGDNILQMPKKTHRSSVIGNQSCSRLCGSVKDASHCKNLFKKANAELLTIAEAVFGGPLQHHELRPHLVCRPCEW